MKKGIYILFLSLIATSCGSLEDLLELNVENSLTESIPVNIPQTSSTAVAFDLSNTVSLNSGDLAQYKDKITAVKINSLTYKFKDFTGNTAGTIPTGTLKFDDVVIGEMADFNISSAATAGTIFEISDAAKLSLIESNFVNNSEISVKLSGTVLSETGVMDFKVEVFMNMTATIKQ
jgi:hypothetical protein